MTRKEVKERVEKLKKTINHYRYLYHVEDKSPISPDALDTLKKELFDLEQKYPEFITLDSPTQRVAGKPLKEFHKVRHEFKMHSLNDAFSKQDVIDWIKRVGDFLEIEEKSLWNTGFYCNLKMDGLAIELVYENGILKTGSTRGDGIIGEDVTQNLMTMESIPLKMDGNFPKKLAVRGEVILKKDEFLRINKDQKKKGGKAYANPRNIAAGSVRQLDSSVTAARKLEFYAYGISQLEKSGQTEAEYIGLYPTHESEFKALKEYGFKIVPEWKVVKSLGELADFYDRIKDQREKLGYEIDGIVVWLNSNLKYREADYVGKAPRAAIAFKFSPKEAETIIEDIKVQIGRTGILTPVAHLRPVEIGGITVKRASLHNLDEIRRLGVKKGDTVIIARAGDVIPQVIKVLSELRTGKEKDFHMPRVCSVCGAKVLKDEEGVYFRCSNKNCGALLREKIYHFISRSAFNIDGLGPKIIDRLIEEDLIEDAADIFNLKESDLLLLERFGEKSAQNIVLAINSKRKIDLTRFIYALGIIHVGEETARDLADVLAKKGKINSPLDVVKIASGFSSEDWQKTENIGPKIAASIFEWFSSATNRKFIEKMDKVGMRILSKTLKEKSGPFKGLTFVFTGELSSLTRLQAQAKIRELGGEVNDSVSKKTNYVVIGEKPGSKYEKAKLLGVKILDERQFIKMINA